MFGSVEFYVIMAVVAAAVVALASRPRAAGEMLEYLLASSLVEQGGHASGPSLELACLPDGSVRLTRRGLEDISMSGAVSLAVRTNGVDVFMEERLTPGGGWEAPASEAVFYIDFLRPGRYHVRYNSERTGLFAAFSLHVRPGLVAERALSR